jgi:hypothetical protein
MCWIIGMILVRGISALPPKSAPRNATLTNSARRSLKWTPNLGPVVKV